MDAFPQVVAVGGDAEIIRHVRRELHGHLGVLLLHTGDAFAGNLVADHLIVLAGIDFLLTSSLV